jgi:hypothetical protein
MNLLHINQSALILMICLLFCPQAHATHSRLANVPISTVQASTVQASAVAMMLGASAVSERVTSDATDNPTGSIVHPAATQDQQIRAFPADLPKVGAGQFRYFVFDIYEASLKAPAIYWASSADQKTLDYSQSVPLLLELTYQRNISRDEFIKATVDQWQHLTGAVSTQHKQWAEALKPIWRDVKEGDTLASLLLADGQVVFYFNRQYLGTLTDPAFGPAFFDIWLSEGTSAPKLRQQLLGLATNKG